MQYLNEHEKQQARAFLKERDRSLFEWKAMREGHGAKPEMKIRAIPEDLVTGVPARDALAWLETVDRSGLSRTTTPKEFTTS